MIGVVKGRFFFVILNRVPPFFVILNRVRRGEGSPNGWLTGCVGSRSEIMGDVCD